MKSILISIKPKYVAEILNGNKTIEIRKTMPNVELPIDVYIYCTKGNKKDWHLIEVVDTDTGWEGYEYDYYIGGKGYLDYCLEGKVVAKFTLNKVEEIIPFYDRDGEYDSGYFTETLDVDEFKKISCIDTDDLFAYLDEDCKTGYAIHISDLVIFNKPKELSDFYKGGDWGCDKAYYGDEAVLTKAPQSFCYVEAK